MTVYFQSCFWLIVWVHQNGGCTVSNK